MSERGLPLEQHKRKVWLSLGKAERQQLLRGWSFPGFSMGLDPGCCPLLTAPWGSCTSWVGTTTVDEDLGGVGWDLSLLLLYLEASPWLPQCCWGRQGCLQLRMVPSTCCGSGWGAGDEAERLASGQHGVALLTRGNQVRKHFGEDGTLQQSWEFGGIDPLPCSLWATVLL